MRALSIIFFCLALYSHAGAQTSADKSKSTVATNKIGGDAQLLSHFVERGLSMSDGNPALNASFLFNLGSQLRLGFWGSNISSLTADEDNFWFKFLAEFDVRFANGLQSNIYISDNHFYKSDQRNGQRIGSVFIYYTYQFIFEWMSNLEGSKGNAEYINFGKYFFWGSQFRYGPFLGFTNSHTDLINSYFDLRATAEYTMSSNTIAELGTSLNFTSDNAVFGKRADPAVWVGLKLAY
jgi:hypothetical protein